METTCTRCNANAECLPLGENRALICANCFAQLPPNLLKQARIYMDEETAEAINAELKQRNITMHIMPLEITEEGFLKSMMAARERLTFNQFLSAFADVSVIIVNALPKLREDLATAFALAVADRESHRGERYVLPENPTREDMITALARDSARDLVPCSCPLCRSVTRCLAHRVTYRTGEGCPQCANHAQYH